MAERVPVENNSPVSASVIAEEERQDTVSGGHEVESPRRRRYQAIHERILLERMNSLEDENARLMERVLTLEQGYQTLRNELAHFRHQVEQLTGAAQNAGAVGVNNFIPQL